MKFTVEVDDFWLDGEDLTEALESNIKRDVVSQISASIKNKVEEQITKRVTETINAKIEALIDVHLDGLIETGTITKNREEISIAKHIKQLFMEDRGWHNLDDKIKSYSKKFSADMKLQYDAAFATQVVMNMKEQGLLKNDVVKMLLEENS